MKRRSLIPVAGVVLILVAGLAAPALAGGSVPICTDPARQERPAVSGNVIVWQDYRNDPYSPDIYMYDLSNPTSDGVLVTRGQKPAVSGGKIVWEDPRGGPPLDTGLIDGIYIYDLSNPTPGGAPLCPSSNDQGDPAISGDKVVWVENVELQDPDGEPYTEIHIYMYDLANPGAGSVDIAHAPGAGWYGPQPAISGDIIVWQSGNSIYMYDLSNPVPNGTKIWDGTVYDPLTRAIRILPVKGPAISGDKVVWARSGGLLYLYDLSNPAAGAVVICDTAYDLDSPAISGDKIVWEDTRNRDWQSPTPNPYRAVDLYMYDLSNPVPGGVPLCTAPWVQEAPAISGNIVVWADHRDGLDIYMYDLSDPNTPPEAPSNPTPTDGQTGVGRVSPALSWSGGDPDPYDGLIYDLYFGLSSPPPLLARDLPEPTHTLGNLRCYQRYYWQVAAKDFNGARTPSPVWSFTTTDEGCPAIDALSPDTCAPGDVVSILGRNFGDTQGVVRIGGVAYLPGDPRILSWSDTQIDIRLPTYDKWACPSTTTLDVFVKAGPPGSRIKSNKVPLAIFKPDTGSCPAIDEIIPSSCAPGDVVSLVGRNLGDTKGVVRIGKVKYPPGDPRILSWTDTQVDFRVPGFNWVCSSGPRSLDVFVKAGPPGSRVKSNKVSLCVDKPPGGCPDITDISAISAAPGDTVVISGSGFGSEGKVILREWLDEDFWFRTPLREAYPSGGPNVLSWTETSIEFQIGSLTGWPSVAEAFCGAKMRVKVGPPGARLKSVWWGLYINGL